MSLKKIGLVILTVLIFGIGFFAATTLQKQTLEEQPEPAPRMLAARVLPATNDLFLETFGFEALRRFDQLFEQRQKGLRDIIAGDMPLPTNLADQISEIESHMTQLRELIGETKRQKQVRDSLMSAYHVLKQTYQKEISFLNDYATKGHQVEFVTSNIFEISAMDQKSSFQYLNAILIYRKILVAAIREHQSLEKNQERMNHLISLNGIIQNYQTRLNLPQEFTELL